MKILFLYTTLLFSIISCGDNNIETLSDSEELIDSTLPYDTTAIDSFSAGVTPNIIILEKTKLDSNSLSKKKEPTSDEKNNNIK